MKKQDTPSFRYTQFQFLFLALLCTNPFLSINQPSRGTMLQTWGESYLPRSHRCAHHEGTVRDDELPQS